MISTRTSPHGTFPLLSDNVLLHRNAAGGYLTVLGPQLGEVHPGRRRPGRVSLAVEGYVVDYLALVNGRRDASALQDALAEKYGRIFGSVLAATGWQLLENKLTEVVEFLHAPVLEPKNVTVTGGSDGFYPVHATFEIIETCNFSCDHCYYSSDPSKTGKIDFVDAIKVMDKLQENGVRVIELTGGECTIHSHFLEILSAAAERFDMVAIITNGYRIGTNEKFAERVCATPKPHRPGQYRWAGGSARRISKASQCV